MEIKFEATKEELIELAKMAYVAQFVFDSSGKFSKGYKYPNKDTFDAALRMFNKELLKYIPESGLLEIDELSEPVFSHAITMEEECEAALNEYGEDDFLDRICRELTGRDYTEQYGGTLDLNSMLTSDVYHILYNNNEKELRHYRLKRLRIEE